MDAPAIQSGFNRLAFRPLLVFAGFVLAFLLTGNYLFDNLRDAIRKDAQSNISAVGMLKKSQIEYWLQDRMDDARLFSENSFFADEASLWMRDGARTDTRRRHLLERMSAFLKGHEFRSIVLYDAVGRVVLSLGDDIAEDNEIPAQVRRIVATGQPGFIDLHRHQDSSFPVRFGFLSPLRNNGETIGAIYLVEDPGQYLFPLIHQWPGNSETAETQLVRKEGNEVVFLDHLRYRDEAPLDFRLPLDTPNLAAARALGGSRGLLEHAVDYRGKEVLSYATEIKGTPWILISKIGEEEAYRTINKMQRAAVILELFVFGLIGAWIWQWRRRTQSMSDAAVDRERMRANIMQMESEKRFRTVFEHTALPMVRNALNGEFLEVNDAWCNMFGYSREQALLQHLSWQRITHPEDLDPDSTLVRRLLAGEIEDFKIEKRYLHNDGRIIWGSMQVSLVRDENGTPEYFISAIQDITERKQAEQLISFMAYHDKLTGLPNRALLFDRLSQAVSQARRDGKQVALLFVDLDGFKAINDEHGHEEGDNVLKLAAQRFLACVRAVDTVARFGGDEFAIILGGLDDAKRAKGIAEKIVQAFAKGFTLQDGSERYVGASVGISMFPEHGNSMDSLLTAADQAMYASKRNGKNTYTFFSEHLPSADVAQ